ncbi:PQQ-binding-like beta-propeller repeat protein [Micromonospora sp. NPDC050397]|uniref:outer membrane protein assembly factor BamB family protein n=1 Tax=Micromonospora sp. NPDC050397 TaxID=3364279 RepID=UPI00384B077B
MIDLGVLDDEPDGEPRRRPGRHRLRPVALALVAVLLLATGGSALPPPPVLAELATLPYQSGAPQNPYSRSGFVLTDKRIVTSVLQPGGTSWSVSAYELDRGHRVWTYVYPASPNTQPELQHLSDVVLVSGARADGTDGMRTVALDERTGRERWSLPHEVWALHEGDDGLAVDRIYPTGSALPDGVLPPGGSAYGSPWGRTYTQPPRYSAAGINLRSGEVRWRSGLLGAVGANYDANFGDRASLPGRGLVVTTGDGWVELWDLATGTVRHRFPERHPDAYSDLGRDLLLTGFQTNEITAYSNRDYRRLWIRQVHTGGSLAFCAGSELICASTPDGALEIVDPTTGATLWRGGQGHNLGRAAGHLIEYVPDYPHPEPIRTVDPRTGVPLTNLTGWQNAVLRADGPVLLTWEEALTGSTWLGLLGPTAPAPVRLGRVPVSVAECEVGAAVIACVTIRQTLKVWRYRTTTVPGLQ